MSGGIEVPNRYYIWLSVLAEAATAILPALSATRTAAHPRADCRSHVPLLVSLSHGL